MNEGTGAHPNRNIEMYLEYEIVNNRPGLLGDLTSLLGNLGISINIINGVAELRRGIIIRTDDINKLTRFKFIARHIPDIKNLVMRIPEVRDRLAVQHGKFIKRDAEDKKVFRFTREEIGVLVDFLGEIFRMQPNAVVGVRGMPRVGKTESIVAGSVHAKKKWLFLSSTLLKQTERTRLIQGEYDKSYVYIIDGAVTMNSSKEGHRELVREIMNYNAVKVVEHPDLFIEDMHFSIDDFDYIIELRENEDQVISYEKHKKKHWFQNEDMGFFEGM